MDVLKELYQIGIVPVIKIEDVEDSVPLAQALCDGGIPCAEVTFRTAHAAEAIRRMTEAFPDMLVGAGTVLTTEQVDRAWAAGAKFMVSPGLNPKVVAYCVEKNIPIVPGCSSPSNIEQALELGLDVVKFFPAEQVGGIAMIKAMAAPYTNVRFIPTGGINATNLNNYLSFPKVLACGGSWMVPGDALKAKDFAKIKSLAQEAMEQMLGLELAHVGINAADETDASATADSFCHLFGFLRKDGNSSVFAGSAVEVMKKPYLGTHGHIGFRTNYIERAVAYMEHKGIVFDYDTAKYGKDGKMTAIYLKDQIGGFAVHLVQK